MKRIACSLAQFVATINICGCAADLSSGKKFDTFAAAPPDKALVYLVRDESMMAAKLPYMNVLSAKSNGKGAAAGLYELKAIVGKDMFVPVLMDPGVYVFKTGLQAEVTLSARQVACLEVGGKYRGVTVFSVEEIKSQEDCRKVLEGKTEGVQLVEAKKLTGMKTQN
jgi:hypothetical protein